MIKFYPRLHNAINHLKKQFSRVGLLLFLILQLGNDAHSQCIPPPPVSVTPMISCGGVPGGNGPCNPLTATGADTYVWTPFAGLYTDCTQAILYTGGNSSTVFAAPTAATIYTVTGTVTATGCTATATAFVNATPQAPVVIPSSVSMCISDPPVKLQISRGPVTSLFCSGPVNIAAPDNNVAGSSNSITVSGIPVSCIITSVTVSINMPHTRIGDMVFVLRAPNGVVLNLDYHISATGGSGGTMGFVNTRISSTGTAALSSGTNPYTGVFRADAQIGAVGGPTGMSPTITTWTPLFAIPNGTWTLGFYDGATSEVGTLTSWCLSITTSCAGLPSTQAVWSPSPGLFLDPAATIPYVAGTATDSLWVKPIPAGVYTYQVTTGSLPASTQSFTNSTAISIPVGGTATAYPSPLVVSGLPVTGINVRAVILHNVDHSRSEDIDILLQSPSGQNVILMSDVGGANTIANASYTFEALGPFMNGAAANPTGTYRPTNQGALDNFPAPGPGAVSQPSPVLAMFSGSHNGTWKLFVMDDDGSIGQGMISGGYTIIFDVTGITCTSPPTSVVVTVGPNAVITTQPANQNVCMGNNAHFNVVATGSGLSYQWQLSIDGGVSFNNLINSAPYIGVNTAFLTITAPALSMSGNRYRVIVNGGVCGTATSNPALLTVNPLPNIVIGPSSYIVLYPGQKTTLTSAVTPNAAATYTWLRNGIPVPNATADTLLVDFSQLGLYRLRVTDINGCPNLSDTIRVTDSAGTLRVYPNPSRGNFQLRLYTENNSTVPLKIIIYNNMGVIVATKYHTQTSSYERIDIDLRRNGKGYYFIDVLDTNGRRLARSKVLVQ
ncbi:MAG TPA: T9SS type A sorting domain-containing protein [Ferruginibacter sp.]|nr:T9SS type A sorting domain-containing protein [Ferruginibacter sp.]